METALGLIQIGLLLVIGGFLWYQNRALKETTKAQKDTIGAQKELLNIFKISDIKEFMEIKESNLRDRYERQIKEMQGKNVAEFGEMIERHGKVTATLLATATYFMRYYPISQREYVIDLMAVGQEDIRKALMSFALRTPHVKLSLFDAYLLQGSNVSLNDDEKSSK